MTFEQIEEFCVVARLENFTKAAEYLYVSQSTLSRHISDLESSLGVQLMRRDNRVFELTEAGKVFYTEMRDLLRRAEAIKIKTQQVSRGKIGELSIASFSPHIPYVFERIREFRRRNSEINCRITTADNTEIVEKIVAGELDIGLVFSFEVPPCRGVKQITVGRDDLCVVVPNDHRLASYSEKTYKEKYLPVSEPKTDEHNALGELVRDRVESFPQGGYHVAVPGNISVQHICYGRKQDNGEGCVVHAAEVIKPYEYRNKQQSDNAQKIWHCEYSVF